jgi:hypothetical protein
MVNVFSALGAWVTGHRPSGRGREIKRASDGRRGPGLNVSIVIFNIPSLGNLESEGVGAV